MPVEEVARPGGEPLSNQQEDPQTFQPEGSMQNEVSNSDDKMTKGETIQAGEVTASPSSQQVVYSGIQPAGGHLVIQPAGTFENPPELAPPAIDIV